jgi:hypothetical protein
VIRAGRLPDGALERALAAAALVLAVTSRGELLVLVALLAPAARGRGVVVPALGLAAAAIASSARWGTTSLDALAGAQAVLGPAGGVGPVWGAAASWLAAATILLVGGRGPHAVRWLATGAAVAAVLAGPAPGGQVPVRVAVAMGAAAAAWALAALRAAGERTDRRLGWLAGGTGGAALVAVLVAGIAGAPDLDRGLLGQGLAIAAAAAAVWTVAERASAQRWGARWSPQGGSPSVVQPVR